MSEHSGGGFVVLLSPFSRLRDSTISTRPQHSKFFHLYHSPLIDHRHYMVCYMLPTASQKKYSNEMYITIIFSVKC